MIEDARVEKIFVFFFLVRLSDGHVFVVAAIKLANLSQFWVRKKKRKQVCLSRELHLDEGRIRSCEPIPGSVPLFCHFPKLI